MIRRAGYPHLATAASAWTRDATAEVTAAEDRDHSADLGTMVNSQGIVDTSRERRGEMSKTSAYHVTAMDCVEKAMLAERNHDYEAEHLLRQIALLFERLAIHELGDERIEPIRSVLHRSAATLALDCGDIEQAKQLAQKGLEQCEHAEIREELLEVLAACDTKEARIAKEEDVA